VLGDLDRVAQHYTARPGRPARELARDLWPLDAWSATARALLAHIAGAPRPADRLTAFAAVVRHLLADPVLPSGLLPADWPAAGLRAAYTDYQRELVGEVRARVRGA
jgi:phenylacetic acid degradation operon negative regulatory protein